MVVVWGSRNLRRWALCFPSLPFSVFFHHEWTAPSVTCTRCHGHLLSLVHIYRDWWPWTKTLKPWVRINFSSELFFLAVLSGWRKADAYKSLHFSILIHVQFHSSEILSKDTLVSSTCFYPFSSHPEGLVFTLKTPEPLCLYIWLCLYFPLYTQKSVIS